MAIHISIQYVIASTVIVTVIYIEIGDLLVAFAPVNCVGGFFCGRSLRPSFRLFYLLKKKMRESFLLASQKSTGLEDGGDGGEGLNDQYQTQNRVCAIL
jgi:hypothetical protein